MADVDLSGKTAIVTGSSVGIGRYTAIAMGRAGAKVLVNYYSHAEEADEVVQAIRDVGAEAIAIRADVSNQEAVELMVATAVQEFGSLDIAVSNAVYSDRQLYYEADMDGFRRTINVTMWGAFHLVRAATQQIEGGLQIRSLIKTKTPKVEYREYPARTELQLRRFFQIVRVYLDDLDRKQFIHRPGFGCTMCNFNDGTCDEC